MKLLFAEIRKDAAAFVYGVAYRSLPFRAPLFFSRSDPGSPFLWVGGGEGVFYAEGFRREGLFAENVCRRRG